MGKPKHERDLTEHTDPEGHEKEASGEGTGVATIHGHTSGLEWGVGLHESILTASLRAVVSAVNRHRSDVEVLERHEY